MGGELLQHGHVRRRRGRRVRDPDGAVFERVDGVLVWRLLVVVAARERGWVVVAARRRLLARILDRTQPVAATRGPLDRHAGNALAGIVASTTSTARDRDRDRDGERPVAEPTGHPADATGPRPRRGFVRPPRLRRFRRDSSIAIGRSDHRAPANPSGGRQTPTNEPDASGAAPSFFVDCAEQRRPRNTRVARREIRAMAERTDDAQLIEQHLPLVNHVVLQVAVHFPRYVDRQELARAGALGLGRSGPSVRRVTGRAVRSVRSPPDPRRHPRLRPVGRLGASVGAHTRPQARASRAGVSPAPTGSSRRTTRSPRPSA